MMKLWKIKYKIHLLGNLSCWVELPVIFSISETYFYSFLWCKKKMFKKVLIDKNNKVALQIFVIAGKLFQFNLAAHFFHLHVFTCKGHFVFFSFYIFCLFDKPLSCSWKNTANALFPPSDLHINTTCAQLANVFGQTCSFLWCVTLRRASM